MKFFLPFLAAGLISGTLAAQNPPDLAAATANYTKKVATIRTQQQDLASGLKKWYIGELDRLEKLVQARGDLNGVLALRSERERMDRPLSADELKSLPDAARANRARLDQGVAKFVAQERAELAEQDRLYIATLESMQTRLTRAGDIEGAVKVKEALQVLGTGAKRPEPPPIVPPGREIGSSRMTGIAAPPMRVAAELKAKGSVEDLAPGLLEFGAPNGNGRNGAKGMLLKNDPATGKNGSTWSFRYTRGGSAYGIQIIHPHGRGQFIVHLRNDAVTTSTPKRWIEDGWGPGDGKRVRMPRAADQVFPLKNDTEYEVVSRVSPTGGFEMAINGQTVATGRATGAEPLSIEIAEGEKFPLAGRGDPAFKGTDLPMKWEAGYAALIVGPMDGGTNSCRDVQFTPSAPGN